ncbi:hypothetical protein LMP03_14285, partial [Staphylococcus aureus]|uniref:hypothetical protein n=1 Tax=Staphylococcus aureus TaxID=1280 RepID=UPI001E524766
MVMTERPAGKAGPALEVDRIEWADSPSIAADLRVSERAADGTGPRAVERGERVTRVPPPVLALDLT